MRTNAFATKQQAMMFSPQGHGNRSSARMSAQVLRGNTGVGRSARAARRRLRAPMRSAPLFRADQIEERPHRLESLVGEVRVRIEADLKRLLARENGLEQIHRVELEAALGQGRLGPRVKRTPISDVHDDRPNRLERGL